MAQDSEQQRSHAPTPRRLEQAREEGRIPRSRELTSALLLATAAGACFGGGSLAGASVSNLLRKGLTFGREAAFDPAAAFSQAAELSVSALSIALPLLAVLTAIALAAPLALGGWLFTAKPLAPDFERLSPGRWLEQTLSAHGAIELTKSIVKALLIGGAALLAVWQFREDILLLLSGPSASAIGRAAHLAGVGFAAAAGAMLLVAATDVPIQLWRHYSQLRMTGEEVRREMKESEGDPLLKQKIRSQQREIARRRMMSEVAKADVVVTNPVHYAVALAWNESGMRAPRVVAKGTELVAARIKEIAAEHHVPVLEAPPLARALHRHADIGDEIPSALYNAVAQVLTWTYALRAGRSGAGLGPIEVPPGFDPQEAQS